MVQYVITPWRDARELLDVRQQLYPELCGAPPQGSPLPVANSRHAAVARISVWVQRGNCPHLVESSAIITSAILNDVSHNSSYCVRAAYSAAFSRFVTGLLDSHQDKRRKLSMYSIAKTLGLPATYVELRHQATHEELPSLPKLRTAARKALGWIWDYYWSKLPASPPSDHPPGIYELASSQTERQGPDHRSSVRRSGDNDVHSAAVVVKASSMSTKTSLSSSTLSNMILDRAMPLASAESKREEEGEVQDENTEHIQAELLKMEQDLGASEERDANEAKEAKETRQDGWAMWEGPWIPKPIGTI